jgi:hypothetical protein
MPQGTIAVTGCGGPSHIIQDCSIAPPGSPDFVGRFEAQAIAAVLQQYQLPESERPRVLRFARNEVRTALFALLMEAFRKEPGARSADEQAMVEAITRLVREKRVEAATAAQNQYNVWASNPCGYEPPPGFTYSARSACVGMSQLFRPESPGLRAFAADGTAAAYKTLQDDPNAERVSSATSSGALLGYGYAVALGAGVAGAAVGYSLPASTLAGIFPYLVKAATEVAVATDTAAIAGATGAGAIGGTLLIVIGAVTTGIVAGMSVLREDAIPGQLQEWLDANRSYDVGAILRYYADLPENVVAFDFTGRDMRRAPLQELYAAFITATLPDYPGTDPAPAPQSGDPRFVVSAGSPDWLTYTAADGSQRAVRLSGRWFADRAGSAGAGEARLTLSISYRDAAGAEWSAGRVGDQFLIVRVGDPSAADYPAPRQSPDLTVQDWSGRTVTARVGG